VTLPLYVYNMIKVSATPVVNALSTLMLLVTILLVWALKHHSKEELI
jgi:spermidine/putrescine transport system permease protein